MKPLKDSPIWQQWLFYASLLCLACFLLQLIIPRYSKNELSRFIFDKTKGKFIETTTNRVILSEKTKEERKKLKETKTKSLVGEETRGQ
ncbi:MAG: hypothetical protein PHY73_02095 [Candidatus Omnitrophica bacterium]|nr:hypothetical protein [Candidatus Omnitrophota bacterium]